MSSPDQAENLSNQIQHLEEFLKTLWSPTSSKIMGSVLFGSPTTTSEADGKLIERDWTIDEIIEKMDSLQDEQDKELKILLARDLMFLLESQDQISGSFESKTQKQFDKTRDFIATLLVRVVSSDINLLDRYPLTDDEVRYEAELLEVIRRITLNPSYILFPGKDRDGIQSLPSYQDFFTFSDIDRQAKADGIYDLLQSGAPQETIDKQQQEKMRQRIEKLTPQEWLDIVTIQEHYILEYLQQRSQRSLGRTIDSVNFWSALIESEQIKASEQAIGMLQTKQANAEQLSLEIISLKQFNQVIPLIEKKFGPQADFNTLLENLP